MTQSEKVLDYIKTHGSIDQWRAMADLHILRLSARVYDLRKLGFDIIGIIRTKRTDDGFIHWMEYTIKEPPPIAVGSDSRGGGIATGSTPEDNTEQ